MSATATIPAPRYVDYVDPDVIAALPASFPCAWVAEESCRRVSDAAADLAPAAREALLVRATSFAEDVLSVLRYDALPEDLEGSLFLDPHGRLQLIGSRNRNKVRVDEDFRIILIRERPVSLPGPRAGTLRQEAREVLCFPLASADRKPVMAIQALDLSSVGEAGTFFLELDAPNGTAYLAGRCDRLRVYGDGKVLILCFRPLPDIDEQGYQIGNPDRALAALPGSAGRRLDELEGGGKLAARLAALKQRATAVDGNEGLEDEAGGAGSEGAGGASSSGSGGSTSDSPFDQPGWAASVAPVLE